MTTAQQAPSDLEIEMGDYIEGDPGPLQRMHPFPSPRGPPPLAQVNATGAQSPGPRHSPDLRSAGPKQRDAQTVRV